MILLLQVSNRKESVMLEEKLKLIRKHDQEGRIRVMIIGLGSVGNYLLSYLLSSNDENLEIIVAGRNAEKLQCDVNIARVAALIRRQNKSNVIVDGTCNLDDVDSIAALISKYQPDFIVNSSRVYPGLKYGSISWKNTVLTASGRLWRSNISGTSCSDIRRLKGRALLSILPIQTALSRGSNPAALLILISAQAT